jgi:hypothetical protein
MTEGSNLDDCKNCGHCTHCHIKITVGTYSVELGPVDIPCGHCDCKKFECAKIMNECKNCGHSHTGICHTVVAFHAM